MFTLNQKLNIELTPEEDEKIREYADSLEYNIPLGVKIVKNKALDRGNGEAIAMFSMLHLHTIFITEEYIQIQKLIEKIAHELVHRKDCLNYGFFKYCFMVQPVIRERYLEPQARAMEKSLELRYRQKVQTDIINNGRKIKQRQLKDKNIK